MASSSSISSNSPSSSSIISITSPDFETSREAMPEFNPIALYEALAPLHWDAEEWDFSTWSEDDEPLTDDEDLQILLHGDLDEGDDEDSWDDDFFSFSEEDAKDTSTTTTQQQEGSCVVDHRLPKTTGTLATTPAMMVATATASAAAMAAATMTPACPSRTSAVRP
jgi:hypothetical protein